MDLRSNRRPPAEAAGPSFVDLVSAFQEVAAGVGGTHRALLDRVELLTRELTSLREGQRRDGELACDGTVTLERFGGHRDRTARALGIGVRTLGMKLRAWKSAGLVPEHL